MPTSLANVLYGRPVIAAVRASALRPGKSGAHPPQGLPFITVARQAGAGGIAMAEEVIARLNADAAGGPPWQCYDKQLIEKVASDHGLSQSLVASLPERPHSLLEDLAQGMCFSSFRLPDEAVYRKVIATMRALASMGHAIIVGRGGVYCTQDLPGGVHVQLVAPRDDRIRRFAEQNHLTESQAARQVDQIDADRQAFYRRFWPDALRRPDYFTLTVNTTAVSVAQLADMIARLVRARQPRGHA